MSKIIVNIDYDGRLWLENPLDSYTFTWGLHTMNFSGASISISTEFELTGEEKISLVKCLTFENSSRIPIWNNLTPDLHRTIEKMIKTIQEAIKTLDYILRQSPKGIRLPPPKFEKKILNQTQSFPVLYWILSKEEQNQLNPLYEHLEESAKKAYDRSIQIPIVEPFRRKQTMLSKEEIEDIGIHLGGKLEIEPYYSLYTIAWENYMHRSFDSAILILATSLETALKSWLTKHSDEIASYLITNLQSPPLENLFISTRKFTGIKLPGHFGDWLTRLRKTRNDIAHKPVSKNISSLEIARWFSVGEAIFKAMSGYDNDPLVGYLVEPIGEKAIENFPEKSKGVVLRMEKNNGEEWLHVIIDTGETWRFNNKSCKKCKEQNFT